MVGVFRPSDGIMEVVKEWSFVGRWSLIVGEDSGSARNCSMLSAVWPVVAVGGGRGLGPHLGECWRSGCNLPSIQTELENGCSHMLNVDRMSCPTSIVPGRLEGPGTTTNG